MYLPLCFKQFTNPYLLVATENKETIKNPSKNEHSPLMGKFRFLHWRSFGNTHGACNSTFHTKQVVSFGIVGRRRWAIESHFLVVQWMDVFFSSSHSSLSDLWCNIFIPSGLPPPSTSLCNAPVRAQRNVSHLTSPQQVAPTDSGFVVVVADVDKHKKNKIKSLLLCQV